MSEAAAAERMSFHDDTATKLCSKCRMPLLAPGEGHVAASSFACRQCIQPILERSQAKERRENAAPGTLVTGNGTNPPANHPNVALSPHQLEPGTDMVHVRCGHCNGTTIHLSTCFGVVPVLNVNAPRSNTATGNPAPVNRIIRKKKKKNGLTGALGGGIRKPRKFLNLKK